MGKVTAIVDREKCHPGQCGHECMKYDPINRSGGEGFHLAEHGKAEIAEELVNEMHKICAKMCPFDAIRIVNLPSELKKDPIHHYGPNLFRLYSLPTPIFGKVIGILGVNGIGKSTAIKILGNVLKPNLGKVGQESGSKELASYFKGTEAQLFFEKVESGEVVVSYKPQQVDIIQKSASGKVGDLLKKIDETGKLVSVCQMLDIEGILDRDVAHISGGEMQRVAIAATVLKKANLYIFDEPTSFLDIKQRINVSRFLQSLASENVSVLVVEHDLLILDYMTDLIHITYGESGAYGVVSMPKSTRVGMNLYLSGMLPEENIRFRDSTITFTRTQHDEKKITEPLVTWNGIRKSFGDFSIRSEEGTIHKHEVVGIVGENGIGKTTFVKMLAGVLEPDSGDVSDNVAVSYKPQYLESSEETVLSVLQEAIKFEVELIRPLQLKPLFMKQLNQLSGGELQRVAIAVCLARDAQLYLLDEPSAYLDVEQRLVVSKVIRDFVEIKGKSALVVDHDLLFIDYISDRIMAFHGEPSKTGVAAGPYEMAEGMSNFLRSLSISMRRDEESHRPRINKEDSVKDREQKESGKLYYT